MNNTLENNQINQKIINESDEMDLIAVCNILIRGKRTIIKITGLFTVLGLFYALLATPYFQSTISLYPAGDIAENNSLLGGNLQGIAQSFGIGNTGQSQTYNIPDIINSRRLKKNIILKSWPNSLDPNGSNLIKYWQIDKQKWYSPRQWISKLLPSVKYSADIHRKNIQTAIEYLGKLISIDEASSGLIIVSVQIEEPELAAIIANYIAEFVKDFISVEQHREAVRNKAFIHTQQMEAKEELAISEEELTQFRKKHPIALDNPDLQLSRGRLIRYVEANQAVYITLRQQYEMAKIEAAKENLFVSILDLAEPAVEKEKPKRRLILFLSLFMGLFFSIIIVFVREIIPKNLD